MYCSTCDFRENVEVLVKRSSLNPPIWSAKITPSAVTGHRHAGASKMHMHSSISGGGGGKHRRDVFLF